MDSESDREEKKEPVVRKRKAEKSTQPAKRKKVSMIVCVSLVEQFITVVDSPRMFLRTKKTQMLLKSLSLHICCGCKTTDQLSRRKALMPV